MLPELKGTSKQVPWATKIRADRLGVWEQADPERFRDAYPELMKQTYAGTWISNRDKTLGEALGRGGDAAGGTSSKSGPAPVTAVCPKSYEVFEGGTTRYVGELRDSATGEPVVDADCPF